MKRYLADAVEHDLRRKMVFLGGARQVGKTTVAKSLLHDPLGYLNWDVVRQREQILQYKLPNVPRLVLDEFHKYRKWRNYLKGLYDDPARTAQILVTGSARLDYYRFGGDSLQGRYHYLRLHPLSWKELGATTRSQFDDLLRLGGFPEPFLSGSDAVARRWSRDYRTRLIREDLLSLETVRDIGTLELLMLRLPELVGQPLSVNALREDLQVSHKTVAKWLDVFERLYAIFRVAPFGAPRIRAVRKERKHYHLDWSLVRDPARRFENMVAVHLLKWVHWRQDTLGEDLDLRYFRDIDGREVDFVLVDGKTPTHLIECKWDDAPPSAHLKYLHERFPKAAAWQITAVGNEDYRMPRGLRVGPAPLLLDSLI